MRVYDETMVNPNDEEVSIILQTFCCWWWWWWWWWWCVVVVCGVCVCVCDMREWCQNIMCQMACAGCAKYNKYIVIQYWSKSFVFVVFLCCCLFVFPHCRWWLTRQQMKCPPTTHGKAIRRLWSQPVIDPAVYASSFCFWVQTTCPGSSVNDTEKSEGAKPSQFRFAEFRGDTE